MRLIGLCISLILCCFLVQSQEMAWRSHSGQNGYADAVPKIIKQDSKFNVWIGSSEGLYRYNGAEFKLFTMQDGLPSNYINDIAIHPIDESIWVSCVSGIAKYNGTSFEKVNISNQEYGRGYRKIFIRQDGQIYIGGNFGALAISGDQKTLFNKENGLSGNIVKTIVALENQSILIGTSKGLNIVSDANDCTLLKNTESFNVRKMLVTRDHQQYMLEGLGKVRKKVLDDWPVIFEARFIGDIFLNSKGELFVSQFRKISILNNDEVTDEISDFPGPINVALNYSFVDHEDHLWVFKGNQLLQSIEKKLSLIQPCVSDSFCQISFADLSQTRDQKIWLSTESGIGLFKDDILQQPIINYSTNKGGASGVALDDQNNYWVSFVLGGLMKWDGQDTAEFFTGGSLRNIQFYCIMSRRNGDVLAGRNSGVVLINNDAPKVIEPEELSLKDVSSICEDHLDQLWLASSHGGLFLLENETVVKSYFEGTPINKIVCHKDEIWILTNGLGLISARSDMNGQLSNIRHFVKSTGFPYQIIKDITFDNSGFLWFSTFDELIRFDPQSNLSISFNKEDHFQPYTFNTNSLLWDSNNTILSVCNAGVQRVDLNKFKPDTTSVKLNFERVLLAGQSTEKTRFKPKENFLTFNYNGIYLKNPEQVRYRTMLKGLKDEWSNWSIKNHMTYSALPSGKYEFQVQANNGNGIMTGPIAYHFSIATPLLKNRLFQAIAFITLLLLGFAFYKKRIQNFQKKSARENKINQQLARLEIEALRSKMNPHFIFNSLSSIQHLILEKNEKGALDYLNKFGKLIRQVLERSSDSKIRLLEEIEMLRNYIDLEALRFDHPFEYYISISPELAESNPEIPYLLIQPFVENAIHHGLIPKINDGMLRILALQENDLIKITIEDNGIGRQAAQKNKNKNPHKQKSKGIEITQNRLKLIHNNLKNEFVKIIDIFDERSQLASGTRVIIEIPI